MHLPENSLDLALRQHHRNAGMTLRPHRGYFSLNRPVKNIPVKEDDRVQRLPLGGGRDLPVGRQVAEKTLDFRFPHVFGVSLGSVKPDESDNSVAIGLLCPVGVVMVSHDLLDLVHELETAVRLELRLAFHFFRPYNTKHGK